MNWHKVYHIYRSDNVCSRLNISFEKEFNLGINIGSQTAEGRRYVWIRLFLPFVSFITDINWHI